MKVDLDVQLCHQMRQIQHKSARAHARKLERIRRDLDELQPTKPVRTAADEPNAPQALTPEEWHLKVTVG